MELFDAHGHLTDEQYSADLQQVIENARQAGICGIVSAAYDLTSSKLAIALASTNKDIYATVGVHPENVAELEDWFKNGKGDFSEFVKNAQKSLENSLKTLKKLAKSQKVVAIGEIGLDYHFLDYLGQIKHERAGESLTDFEKEEIKNLQQIAFEKQILLAEELELPIVVHSRDAMGDTLKILQKYRLQKESLLHCYSGSIESAKILMQLGFSFSFGGVVTFKNAHNVQEVVKELPLERILLETDCPYMSPEPFRGKRNEPKNVVYVADKISKIKNIPIEQVALVTTQNSMRLFGIGK